VLHVNLFKDLERFAGQRTVVEWEIDPTISPVEPVRNADSTNLHIFTHNRERLPLYQDNGFQNATYLPLCTNPKKFYPVAADETIAGKFGCDISFVGSVMHANQTRLMKLCVDRISVLAGSDAGWLPVRDWLNDFVNQPPKPTRGLEAVAALEALLEQQGFSDILTMGPDRLLISACLDEYLAYCWRRHVVAAFLPLGIQLWGDADWRVDFPDHYRGVADHYLDLPKLYSVSRINLDICRTYQANIVTMRIFDVMACGGFVLADRSPALLELFTEDYDIVCYESPEEAYDKALYYLRHDSERKTIAEHGHAAVVHNHTFAHRIRQILASCGLSTAQLNQIASTTT
jgi:spore maturation protein CgeB